MDLMQMSKGSDANRMEYHATGDGSLSDALILTGSGPFTVVVSAGLIEYTNSNKASIEDDSAVWIAWPSGTVAVSTGSVLDGAAVALRYTGSGTWDVSSYRGN